MKSLSEMANRYCRIENELENLESQRAQTLAKILELQDNSKPYAKHAAELQKIRDSIAIHKRQLDEIRSGMKQAMTKDSEYAESQLPEVKKAMGEAERRLRRETRKAKRFIFQAKKLLPDLNIDFRADEPRFRKNTEPEPEVVQAYAAKLNEYKELLHLSQGGRSPGHCRSVIQRAISRARHDG